MIQRKNRMERIAGFVCLYSIVTVMVTVLLFVDPGTAAAVKFTV